jgi:hypothetical protein
MGQNFIPGTVNQTLLFPPSLHDWLPDGHLAFRYLSGDQHPDHATIAEFRKHHLEALSGLFTQALPLCSEAGLVKLGHVFIDGTKIKANASRGPRGQVFVRGVEQAQAHERDRGAPVKQEIDALLAAAETTDAEEGQRRHRLFQRSECNRCDGKKGLSVRGNGSSQARRRGGSEQRPAACRRVAERGDAGKTANRGWTRRVQDAQGSPI